MLLEVIIVVCLIDLSLFALLCAALLGVLQRLLSTRLIYFAFGDNDDEFKMRYLFLHLSDGRHEAKLKNKEVSHLAEIWIAFYERTRFGEEKCDDVMSSDFSPFDQCLWEAAIVKIYEAQSTTMFRRLEDISTKKLVSKQLLIWLKSLIMLMNSTRNVLIRFEKAKRA